MTAPPLPRLTPESGWFWTAGASHGRLLVLRCGDCGTWIHPPSPECPACGSRAVAPEPTAGRGQVFTFTVNHQALGSAVPVPYVVAIVELDEQPGLQLATRLVGCDPETVHIGMPVEVRFEVHGDVHLPLFTPAGPAGHG